MHQSYDDLDGWPPPKPGRTAWGDLAFAEDARVMEYLGEMAWKYGDPDFAEEDRCISRHAHVALMARARQRAKTGS